MCQLLGVLVLAVFVAAAFGQDPRAGSSTVIVGAGGNFLPRSNIASGIYSTAPSVIGSYELRIQKYVGVELGVENAWPVNIYRGPYGIVNRYRVHTTFLPIGARGFLPIRNGRIELYAGLGAAHVWHSEYEPYQPYRDRNQWLWQTNAGGRFALDHGHHFWAGTTLRYYRDGLGTSR